MSGQLDVNCILLYVTGDVSYKPYVSGQLDVNCILLYVTGDVSYKPYVSGQPDVNCIELDGTEDYVVLACDGMWDCVSHEELVQLVNEHLEENNGDRSTVAHKLVKTAKFNGSHDNISVVVVFFNKNTKADNSASADEKVGEEIKEADSDDKSLNDKEDENKQQDNNTEKDCADSEKKDDSNKDSSKDSSEHSSNVQSSFSGVCVLSGRTTSKTDSQKPVISAGSFGESESTNQGSMDNVLANQSPVNMSAQNSSSPENMSPENISPEKTSIHSIQSDTSGTDLALMSKTASRCINNRKAKRSKNGRNGRGKQNGKGAARGRLVGAGLMTYNTQKIPPRSRSAESNLSLAQKSMLHSGDQIFEMLTGCTPHAIRKAKSPIGKWTVAVEMEGASAMFEDIPSVQEKGRRKSDTHFYHKK